MSISRRDFLKLGPGAAAGWSLMQAGESAGATTKGGKLDSAAVTTSVCPYCAVGCGLLVYSRNNAVINIEGDPDHPISRGRLCAKGSSLSQLVNSPYRETKPKYRSPGAEAWQEVSWDWALDKIARNIKQSRDASFVRNNSLGQEVNRCEGIASVGSAALDNEECYLYQKWLRSLGLIFIEHQARI